MLLFCFIYYHLSSPIGAKPNLRDKRLKEYRIGLPTIGRLSSRGWEGGGLTNVYKGRLRPEVQPLTLLYTISHEKGTIFVYLILTNGALSHTLFRTLYPFKLL